MSSAGRAPQSDEGAVLLRRVEACLHHAWGSQESESSVRWVRQLASATASLVEHARFVHCQRFECPSMKDVRNGSRPESKRARRSSASEGHWDKPVVEDVPGADLDTEPEDNAVGNGNDGDDSGNDGDDSGNDDSSGTGRRCGDGGQVDADYLPSLAAAAARCTAVLTRQSPIEPYVPFVAGHAMFNAGVSLLAFDHFGAQPQAQALCDATRVSKAGAHAFQVTLDLALVQSGHCVQPLGSMLVEAYVHTRRGSLRSYLLQHSDGLARVMKEFDVPHVLMEFPAHLRVFLTGYTLPTARAMARLWPDLRVAQDLVEPVVSFRRAVTKARHHALRQATS